MPSFIQVPSLYSLSIGCVFENLYHRVRQSQVSVEPLRKIIQSSLHSGIREHLVQIATVHCRNDIYSLLDLLSVLLDRSIRRLDHSRGADDATLLCSQCSGLFQRLEQCEATGLHELTIKVSLDPRRGSGLETVSCANVAFHRVLRAGLAASLRYVVLRSVCDNEILRLLGSYCTHLYHLDVSSSWLVDDGGLQQLCFQNPALHTAETYRDANEAPSAFLSVLESDLNPCCRTLNEVRIQDTNTSEVGVMMLIFFITHLKSLGGFIYYRNIGDAIVSVYEHKSSTLALTDLWDTVLSLHKAKCISLAAPNLANLYTRASCLMSVACFTKLTSLTIDFDFVDYTVLLEEYLEQFGGNLRKLVLVDQNHSIDLEMLGLACPSLEELGAKLEGNWPNPDIPLLPKLTTCRIRIGTTAPFKSILVNSPSLSDLEVCLEEDKYGIGVEMLDDKVISNCLVLNEHPACLQSFLINTECSLSISSVHLLIEACPRLRFIGELQAWTGITDKDVEELQLEVQSRNLDFMFRFRGCWYPQRSYYQAVVNHKH